MRKAFLIGAVSLGLLAFAPIAGASTSQNLYNRTLAAQVQEWSRIEAAIAPSPAQSHGQLFILPSSMAANMGQDSVTVVPYNKNVANETRANQLVKAAELQ